MLNKPHANKPISTSKYDFIFTFPFSHNFIAKCHYCFPLVLISKHRMEKIKLSGLYCNFMYIYCLYQAQSFKL